MYIIDELAQQHYLEIESWKNFDVHLIVIKSMKITLTHSFREHRRYKRLGVRNHVAIVFFYIIYFRVYLKYRVAVVLLKETKLNDYTLILYKK